jgi:hypothetical protein
MFAAVNQASKTILDHTRARREKAGTDSTNVPDTALYLWARGFNVIPLTADKTPALRRWKHWQTRRQAAKDVEALFERRPPGIGVITGAFGDFVVLDIDGPEGEALLTEQGICLPRTPEVRTLRGRHLWFKTAAGQEQPSVLTGKSKLDLIGKGRYVVAPPSLMGGHRYAWTISLEEAPLALLPEELVGFLNDLHARVKPSTPYTGSLQTHEIKDTDIQLKQVTEGKVIRSISLDSCLDTSFNKAVFKVNKGDIEKLFSDPEIVHAVSSVLGIPDVEIGRPFCCVIPGHQENRPSASLGRNSKDRIVYYDWHERDGLKVYTLPEVYFARTTGQVRKLRGPEFAVWALRLLADARVLEPVHFDLCTLPESVGPSVRKLYEGFRLLLSLKWTYDLLAPTTFSWRFAAAWCGVSETEAGDGMRELLDLGVVRIVDRHRGRFGKMMAVFAPALVRPAKKLKMSRDCNWRERS